MPRLESGVDIDVSEFLDNCSEKELQEVLQWIEKSGLIRDRRIEPEIGSILDGQAFKLIRKKHLLLKEQEENILKIAENL